MESWQLTIAILGAVVVGVMLPALFMAAIGVHRLGKQIADVGPRLGRTAAKVELIADRVEVLSRDIDAGEIGLGELIASLAHVARGIERGMNLVGIMSAVMASVGSAVGAYMAARSPAGPGAAGATANDHLDPDASHTPAPVERDAAEGGRNHGSEACV